MARHPIYEAWLRLEQSFHQRGWSLPEGASHQGWSMAERAMGIQLPLSLRMSALRHDGSGEHVLPAVGRLLSVEEMLSTWHMARTLTVEMHAAPLEEMGLDAVLPKPVGPIQCSWFRPQWIPIAVTAGDEPVYLMLDFDPMPGGRSGQVIVYSPHHGPSHVIGPSLTDLLTTAAKALERHDLIGR